MSNPSRRGALKLTAGLALTGAFALTGCGRGDDTAAATTTAAPVGTSPATGTVTVWAAQGDADVLAKVIKPFEAANPDVTVKVTLIPNAEYYTKLQSAIAAGKGPDVAQFFPESQSQFLDPAILRPVPDGLVDKADFFESLWAAGVAGNVAYTVPWYAYTYALVYRADLARKAGVKAPATWDETVPFLKALQGAGAGHGLGADIGWDIFNGQDVAMYAWQAGGSLLSSGGKWALDSPAMVDALRYNASFFTSGTADTSGPTFLDAQPYFVSGRTAMMITGPWVVGQLDTAAKKEGWTAAHVATAPLPAGASGSTSFSAGGSWGVLAGDGDADASWKLVRYLAKPSTQVAQYKAYSSLPAVISAWDDPAIADQPLLDAFLTQLKNTRAFPQVSTWQQVATRLGKEMEAVAKGKESAAKAAANVQAYAVSLGTGAK
ncbi:extracellular solute-binding protein [Streptomyces sp. WI04-05B]|uniref:extracellular solute-binding protein n=1 Tax=Streptomyces TaxID=1883 RepID=UPI0029B96C27|nr:MULTISPECIES: extracellular solute-binding protein [unclassified Streptomyces]MDX2543446.1 extracellular solute-binding protein [Streptomyces sp. WI04-05B]MDX2589115.1 extracellular solute-binding protein [Streptomyces sp. WI04-05A]MDX3746618.1 extracellular solute-binding protein [Streptomyces sp. AK08-02]